MTSTGDCQLFCLYTRLHCLILHYVSEKRIPDIVDGILK